MSSLDKSSPILPERRGFHLGRSQAKLMGVCSGIADYFGVDVTLVRVAWALGKLPASVTAVTILIQPVVAGLLGWWIFGETLTPVQALGGALVLGAIVLAQRSQRAKPDGLKQREAR